MADFRKFKFVSPGVRVDEIDNTLRETVPRETGPVFIGRAKRGPIFKPIFVTSAKELIDIFGQPETGTGAAGDVWRNGDCLAPMYGLYAAYAYLQNHNAATFVRLAGDEHPIRTSGYGEAGWTTRYTSPQTSPAKDGGAYALFVADVGSVTRGTLTDSASPGWTGTYVLGGSVSPYYSLSGLNIQIKIITDGGINKYQVGYFNGSSYVYGTEKYEIVGGQVDKIYVNGIDTGITITFNDPESSYIANETLTITQSITGINSINAVHAATFYVDEGALALEGRPATGGPVVAGNAGFIYSSGSDFEFVIRVYDTTSDINTYKNKIVFNFNDRSSKYIRKVFNTNPTLSNEDITKPNNVVNYWLGESYRSSLYKELSQNSSVFLGCLVKIERNGISGANHLAPFRAAESGWVFAQNLEADGAGVYGVSTGNYDPAKMQKLFKFHSIDGGSWFHANIKVSIDRIRYSRTRTTPYGSFDVVVRSAYDTDKNPVILEMFANCNLDPTSANFILRKIGDVHYEWDPEQKRYIKYGTYENNSKYIYVEVDQSVLDGSAEPSLLPWGFFGPPIYKDVSRTNVTSLTFDNQNDWIQGGGAVSKIAFPLSNSVEFPLPTTVSSITFKSPSLRLREMFSEEGTSRSSEVFWGARSLKWDVDKYDSDYQDYLRNDNLIIRGKTGDDANMKYSFIFTLDDVCFEEIAGPPDYSLVTRAIYVKDSYKTGRSITAGYLRKQDGTLDTTRAPDYRYLCDNDYSRFTMVLYGGTDGMDITEKDPFRNTLNEGFVTTDDATESYSLYSLLKAIDVIADKDIVFYDSVFMPGITNHIVNKQLAEMAKSRKDCIAILDLPGQYLPPAENNSDEKYRLGSVAETIQKKTEQEVAENNSYAATYFNWIRVTDPFNRTQRVWLPPSVAAAGVLAYTRYRGDVWDAPAGYAVANLSLGHCGLTVVDVMFTLKNEDRDSLYEHNINPISRFPEGIIIMGQKTLQSTPSYLDRINIRLLVNHIKRYVEFKGKRSLFEPNIYITWQRFINEVDPFLRDIQTKGGLVRYEIVFDDTTTTMEMVDRNEMYAKIYIQPSTVAEFFGVDLVIAKSGVSFVD